MRAALSAVPYFIRQENWLAAAGLLEVAFTREPSRANAAAMLPTIQLIARHDSY